MNGISINYSTLRKLGVFLFIVQGMLRNIRGRVSFIFIKDILISIDEKMSIMKCE